MVSCCQSVVVNDAECCQARDSFNAVTWRWNMHCSTSFAFGSLHLARSLTCESSVAHVSLFSAGISKFDHLVALVYRSQICCYQVCRCPRLDLCITLAWTLHMLIFFRSTVYFVFVQCEHRTVIEEVFLSSWMSGPAASATPSYHQCGIQYGIDHLWEVEGKDSDERICWQHSQYDVKESNDCRCSWACWPKSELIKPKRRISESWINGNSDSVFLKWSWEYGG